MRVACFDYLKADGGWRPFWFLKVTTDDGLVGWSEYTESPRNRGLTQVIQSLSEQVVGQDPRRFGRISAELYARTRLCSGGMNQQAISAIENALLDLAARAMGVPVYALFGGPMRERVPLYWSHCGNFRVRHAAYFERELKTPPMRSLNDVKRLGQEVRARGFNAAKTSPMLFLPDGVKTLNPGFAVDDLDFGHNVDNATLAAIADQLEAFREGLGPEPALLMDVNFSFQAEALRRVARATEASRLSWLEADVDDPSALAEVRRATDTPIASCETLFGRRSYRRFLDAGAIDVAVVDVAWNGMAEAVKIANLAESYGVNIAPHNANGPLADLMSAHFCAAVPNVRLMEIEVDDVAWKDDLLTLPRVIENGAMAVPTGPGWGAQIDEDALALHPWRPR